MSNLSIKNIHSAIATTTATRLYDYIRVQLQVQLLLRLLLATTIAISISGITRRANRYSTQIAAVYLHVADRYSTSTSGITRRANRYSTQIAAVLACSRPIFDKHQQHNAKSGPLLFQNIVQQHITRRVNALRKDRPRAACICLIKSPPFSSMILVPSS